MKKERTMTTQSIQLKQSTNRTVIEIVLEKSVVKSIDKATFPFFKGKNVKEEKSYRMKWR